MNIADVILILFIGFGLIIGLLRKWWRLLIGLVVFSIVICAYLYLGPVDYFSNFIRYDLLNWLVENNIMQPIVINLEEQFGVTLRIETVQEAFLLLQNFDIDPKTIVATADVFCKMIAIIIGLPVIILASLIISTVLYWLILRWIMPKILRKGIIPMLFGGVLGAVGYGIIGLIIICSVYSPVYGLENNIINPLLDSNSELYKAVVNLFGSGSLDNVTSMLNTVSGYIKNLNPIADSSFLCKPLINLLDSMGLDPFYIISTTSNDGEKMSFIETFDNFLKDVSNAVIEKSGSVAGA